MLRLKLLCHNKNNRFYHLPRHRRENVMSAISFNSPLERGPAQPEGVEKKERQTKLGNKSLISSMRQMPEYTLFRFIWIL